MFSADELDNLTEQIMAQLKTEFFAQDAPSKGNKDDGSNKKKVPKLSLESALVILGLFEGLLEVSSILFHRDQHVEILLIGSLRRKTRLDKMLDKLGAMSFDNVLRAFVGRVR